MSAPGKFFVFDGIDGAGKTTQVRRLADRLRGLGREVITVQDPGSTALGRSVRELLLHRSDLNPDLTCEVFLLLGARAQTAAEIIRPNLAAGRVVISDRFVSATLAYQGFGSGFDIPTLQTLARVAVAGLEPDLTLVFDMDFDDARRRVGKARDRIEARDESYHRRVAEGFRELARRDPDRYHRIDASATEDAVAESVFRAVEPKL